MPRTPILSILSLSLILATTAAAGQPSPKIVTPPGAAKPAWVQPGTPGSPIDGTIFHAQILLSAAGFSSGVIDGKDGMSFKAAVRGFQQSRGLPTTGKLDVPTRRALIEGGRPSTANVKLSRTDLGGNYVYPYPKKAEGQAKLKWAGYRNMLEEAGRALPHDAGYDCCLKWPDGADRHRPDVATSKCASGQHRLPRFASQAGASRIDGETQHRRR